MIGQIARRLKTSPEQVTKSLSQLHRHGHISLTSRGGCVLLRHLRPSRCRHCRPTRRCAPWQRCEPATRSRAGHQAVNRRCPGATRSNKKGDGLILLLDSMRLQNGSPFRFGSGTVLDTIMSGRDSEHLSGDLGDRTHNRDGPTLSPFDAFT